MFLVSSYCLDLLKHTEKSHHDYSHLESAVASLKVVMRQVYTFDCCKTCHSLFQPCK